MQSKDLTIHWVRHAESCSNFDQGTVNDNVPKNYNEKCGYKQLDTTILQGKKDPKKISLTSGKGSFIYEPNLSFIGMQHAIMLGRKFVNNEMKILPYDYVFVSPVTRTIMTALMAFRHYPNIKIYVIPFISEHLNVASKISMDFQNTPVGSYDLKKRIQFIKDWLANSWLEYYDDIEIIEILNHIREKIKNNKSQVHIYNEIMNALQCRPLNYKLKNKCESSYILDKIKSDKIICNMKKVINLLIDSYNNFGDIEKNMIDKLKNLIDPNIIRGPQVDFSILEFFEKKSNKLESNFDDFYDKILPLFFNKFNNNKILCVSHGSVIKQYFNLKYKDSNIKIIDVANTQVLQEKITIDMENNAIGNKSNNFMIYHKSLNPMIYYPISIRGSFENFEYLNFDVCRTESVKGIINYYMSKDFENEYSNKKNVDMVPANDTKLVPAKSKGFGMGFYYSSKDYVNPDLQFYYNKKWKDYMPDTNVLNGGYYQKYQKYKQKYLQLKNELDN